MVKLACDKHDFIVPLLSSQIGPGCVQPICDGYLHHWMVVVDGLTAKTILGLDFLEAHDYNINIKK